ncbi:MAG: outer membrane beta-barrel protein [Bacteroidales bacterium]|nr:outer membrane beta-barrel protein [Bacteroidales bacterium]
MKFFILKAALLLMFLSLLCSPEALAQFEQKLTLQFSAGASSLVSEDDVFKNGAMFNGGVQYNFSRRFAMSGLVMYGMYFDNLDFDINATYFNLGVGASAKYKFLHASRVNPYLLFGVSACFVKVDYTLGGNVFTFDQPVTPGILFGAGLDYNLSDNLAFFLQGGYNETFARDDGFPSQGAIYALLGVNISMFKARTL